MIRPERIGFLTDFSGGLNTKAGPLNIADNETPCCINVHTNIFKTLKKRRGFVPLNNTPLSQLNGNGLYDFAVSSTLRKLVGCFGTSIYKMDNLDGEWDLLKTGMSDSIYQFDNFVDSSGNSHLIICNWAKDQPQIWDGSSSTTSAIPNAPAGTAPKVYQNRVFILGYLSSRIYVSDAGSYTSYNTYYDEPTPDGDYFVGWGELKGILYAFKRYSIFRLSYTGSSPLYTRKKVANIGTIAPRSICNITVPDRGEVLAFLGPDARIYIFDGSDAYPISTKIEEDNGIAPVSLGTIDKDINILKYAWALNYEPYYWYILCLANRNSSKNNVWIIWDYASNSFWAFSNMYNLSGTLVVDNLGQKRIYTANYDGTAYLQDYGNSDNGENIESYWLSKRFDIQQYPVLKKGSEVWVTVKTIGNFPLNFYYRKNWESTWTSTENITQYTDESLLGSTFILGQSKLGGKEALTKVFNLPKLANLLQFKVSDNSKSPAWNLLRIDVPVEYLAVSKGA